MKYCRKNRFIRILCSMFLCMVMLAGCQNQQYTPAIEDVKEMNEKPSGVIGVTLAAESTYLLRVAHAMESAAKEKGVILDIQYAQWDAKLQTQQMDEFMEQGVEAIILAPVNSKSALLALKKAAKAEIPVINVNMKVDGISSEYIQTYVGASSLEEGEKAAMLFTQIFDGQGGKIGIVEGSPGTDPQIYRTEAFVNYLSDDKSIEIAGIGNGEWKRDKARLVTIDLMRRNPDISGIYCHDSEMGMGAVQALEELGCLQQVSVVSIAEGEEYMQALRDGKLAGIITQPAEYEGRYSVYAAVWKMQGKEIRLWYKDPIEILTKENIDMKK